MAWLDNETIVVVDEHGVTRVTADGDVRRIFDLTPAPRPARLHAPARLYVIGNAIAVLTKHPTASTSRLIVIDTLGRVLVSQRLSGLNSPHLVVDEGASRAIVDTGAQMSGGVEPMYLLQLGESGPRYPAVPGQIAVR